MFVQARKKVSRRVDVHEQTRVRTASPPRAMQQNRPQTDGAEKFRVAEAVPLACQKWRWRREEGKVEM